MNKRSASAAGFTLIEITIAIAILATMLFVGYSALSNISWGKRAIDDRRELRLTAASVMNRITRELQLSFGQLPLLPPREDLKKPFPSAVVMIGQPDVLDNESPGDTLTFVALEGGQYLPDGGRHSGVVQITYRVKKDSAQSDDPKRPYFLIREETPHTRPPERAYAKTMTFPITNAITALSFRYYDSENDTWVDSWGRDGREGLPRLIKCSLTLKSPLGDSESFSTVVAIRSAARPQ